jgi:hypothetical protein
MFFTVIQEPGRRAAANSSPQHPAAVSDPGRHVLIFSIVHTGTRQARSCEQFSPTSCCCPRPWPPCSVRTRRCGSTPASPRPSTSWRWTRITFSACPAAGQGQKFSYYFPFERHITGLWWQIRVSIHLLSRILFSCFRMLFRI